MRKATKLLTLVLAALMIMSVVSIPASAAFTDVSVENEALYEAVELLSTLNIAKGTTETTFGPDELVTRQQMAAFIFRLMKAGKSIEGGTNETTFADLDDATFYYMISWANQTGVITGRNATTFDPKGNITLQDAYTMLVRALGYEKDEKLPYPFGYINQAEELGLDENLPSSVNYGDKLTRGDVAILLANAFYADMNKVISEYGWISVGTGRYEQLWDPQQNAFVNGNEIVEYSYVLKEEVATVAKDIFGVETEKFLVTATANTAALGNSPIKTSQTQDVETIKGIRYDEDGYQIHGNFEFKFADLGLEGKSDDYLLDEITLFVKKADKLADDEIVAAKSNLIKKTVAAKDVVIDRSVNEEKEYYVGGVKDPEALKTMTGYVEFAGTKAYLDGTNAPYSYKQLSDKYNNQGLINKAPVQFLELSTIAHDTVGTRFTYATIANTNFNGTLTNLTQQQNPAYDGLDQAFVQYLPRVYAGGLAELDVYDSNGDGYAEYVIVKNYDAYKIEDANGNRVKLTALSNNAQAYIENKNIVIKGDYKTNANVLVFAKGTTNNLVDTKYIEVKAGLDTVDSTVYSVVNEGTRPNSNFVDYTVTLKSGEKLSSVDANLKYNGYTAQYPSVPGTAVKFLVKDGIIVAGLGATAGTFDTAANYGIVLPYTTNVANKYTNPGIINNTAFGNTQYVFEVSGVADGKFVSQLFVNVLVDGKVVAVKLADSIYTKVRYSNNAYSYNANNTYEALEIAERNNISEATLVEAVLQAEYANKIVTYTAGANNDFVLKALNLTGNLTNAVTEDAVAFTATNAVLKNYANTVYEFTTQGGAPVARINMQNYSKFIVETTDANTGKAVYTVYTAETLPKFTASTFTTMYGILVNNTASTTLENVGIIYGKTNAQGLAAAGTKNLQIVVGSTTRATTAGTEVVLSLLDPKTATVTNDVVATTNVQNAAIGKVVELRDDGKAYAYTVAQDSYSAANMFETTFSYGNDSYDANSKFLTLNAIANAGNFVVNADTTYLWFTNKNTYQMVDATILDADFNPYDSALGSGANGNFQVFVVADENNNTAMDQSIKVVKTIIVTKAGTDLANAN